MNIVFVKNVIWILTGDEFHYIMECQNNKKIRSQLIPSKFTSSKSVFDFRKLFSANRKTQLKLSKLIMLGGVL